MSITKTFTRDMGRLAIDPNQAGLVVGYDMVPDGVTLEDKSGNGNHGVISGAAFEFTEIGPSMRLVGAGEYIETAYTGTPTAFSMCGWFLPRSKGEGNFGRLFGKGIGVLELFINGTDVTFRYENGFGVQNIAITDGYIQDQYQHICITYNESGEIKYYLNSKLLETTSDSMVLDSSDLYVGNYNGLTRAFDGNISNFKFLEITLTAAEIQAEYLQCARAINWKSDYGVDVSIAAESPPGELSNSVARKETGTHVMTTDTIHGKTCKVIECVTPGVVQIPTANFLGDDTQAAYGSNKFWINKADASEMVIGFISDIAAEDTSSIGYQLVFAADESIELRRVTGVGSVSLMKTAAAFFTAGAWHSVKTTRTLTGITTVYFDDVALNVTGGSGTNPVTDNTVKTSKYWVIGSDAGDKVAWAAPNGEFAITKYQGVV